MTTQSYINKLHKTYAWFIFNSYGVNDIVINFACHINDDENFGVTQVSNLCKSMPKSIKREVVQECINEIKSRVLDQNNILVYNLATIIELCNA